MTEAEIKAEARLLAIEYQLGHIYNMLLKMISADEDVVTIAEMQGITNMDRQAIGISDPAMSDHVLGEFQDALARLHREARLMRAMARNP